MKYNRNNNQMNIISLLQNFSRVVVHIEESEGLTDVAIQKLAREDTAVFSVTAQNTAGKATISFNLRVDGEYILVKETDSKFQLIL